jgi:hypothetical protein
LDKEGLLLAFVGQILRGFFSPESLAFEASRRLRLPQSPVVYQVLHDAAFAQGMHALRPATYYVLDVLLRELVPVQVFPLNLRPLHCCDFLLVVV